jgi:ATP-binding cassette subfamily B protein
MSRSSFLLAYLRPHRAAIVGGAVAVVLAQAFQLAVPQIFRAFVDGLPTLRDTAPLRTFAWLIIGVTLLSGIFRFLMRYLIIGASRRAELALRNDLFDHLTGLPLTSMRRYPQGDLISRATNDLASVREILGPALMNLLNTAASLVLSLAAMAAIDPGLTLLALLPVPLLALFVWRVMSLTHHRSRLVQEALAAVTSRLQEDLTGIRVLKAWRQEAAEETAYLELNRDYLAAKYRLIRVSAFSAPVFILASGIGAIIVLAAGGARVVAGEMTVGELVAFLAYLAMMTWPVFALGWVVSLVQRGTAALDRIMELFALPPEEMGGETAGGERAAPSVELRGLDFAYPGGVPALTEVSFTIPAGATVGITGPVGSGKSTLARLLLRLYDPPAGTLLLDGTDLLDLPLADLREMVSFAPQEPSLFSETLADNLALGRPVTDGELRAAVRRAALSEDVGAFPDGLSTMVGERGITLSGGQRLRAGLARTILHPAPLVLLDDPFAEVDERTVAALLAEVFPLLAGRTAIIISQRAAVLSRCDLVAVLEEGRLTAFGPWRDLTGSSRYLRELLARERALAVLSEGR